jgi:hypothetical protein
MVREYELPPLEGPTSTGPTKVKIYSPKEIPFKIGSLEKQAFSSIDDWMIVLDKQGYGFGYRIGTKEGLIYEENEPITLFLHFASLVATSASMPPEIVQRKQELIKDIMQGYTIERQQLSGQHIFSMFQNPPEWMLDELRAMFGKR